jgi:hypothetical protein
MPGIVIYMASDKLLYVLSVTALGLLFYLIYIVLLEHRVEKVCRLASAHLRKDEE